MVLSNGARHGGMMTQNQQLLNEVADLYSWLDSQTCHYIHPKSLCSACGDCCNFKQFEYLLFVTGPELIFLSANLAAFPKNNCHTLSFPRKRESRFSSLDSGLSERALCTGKLKKMSTDCCPYNSSGKCTVYNFRFSSCRIFCCNADKDFQVTLSESAIKKLKSICQKFEIPYNYTDLKTALENFNL